MEKEVGHNVEALVVDSSVPTRYWCLEWHKTIDSTMTRARDLVDRGSPPGTVVVTDFQFAGRGTRGRTWDAPPSTCLMFTIALDPSKVGSLEELPVELGERLAQRLKTRFDLDIAVKPPNDLLVEGRKICGILCSSRIRGGRIEQLLCGIGLNTRMSAEERPIPEATSLSIEGCEVPSHEDLLEWLLEPLKPFVWEKHAANTP